MNTLIRYIAVLGLLAFFAASAQADLLDGFEDGNITEYTTASGAGSFSASAGSAHDGAFGLRNGPTGAWLYRTDAAATVSQGDTFSAWLRFDGSPSGRAYFMFGASAAGGLSFIAAPNSGNIRLQENPGFGFVQKATSSQSFTANKWYRMEVVWGVGGLTTGNLYDSDGTTLLNSVSDTLTPGLTSGGFGFRSFSRQASWDTVQRVPEPASLALLGLGVLAFARKRRKRA